jgi:hypothetical protein
MNLVKTSFWESVVKAIRNLIIIKTWTTFHGTLKYFNDLFFFCIFPHFSLHIVILSLHELIHAIIDFMLFCTCVLVTFQGASVLG